MDENLETRLRVALEAELASIEGQLADHGVAGEAAGPESVTAEGGFADSAQVSAERSEIIGLIDQLRATRAEVADALARMDEGAYGLCEACGQPIAPERLEALPSARLCVSCKQARRG